jgi:hypothetical protein
LEDSDRLTVFFVERLVFRGLDGFSGLDLKTGFLRNWGRSFRIGFSQELFPKEEKLIEIGFLTVAFLRISD